MSQLEPEQWLPKFGLNSFRPGQRQVVEAVLAGRDTLCIMPTGGGKSLCYQLPTVAREGVTLVISPLIALMKDQVDALNAIGIPATYINSSLANAQQQARIQGMVGGEYKLVYVAPERLRSNSFLRAALQTKIQLLAVDEAHCISHWGHDFRPDYARLGRFRNRLGNPQTIALTATATSFVQQDISKILELREPATFVTGFARTNLHISVMTPKGNVEKDQQLIGYLNSIEGCGIIYASTRKNCEHLVELLQNECGRRVEFYHAGLASEVRRKVQEEFMSGEIEIIVATNAFGMGIDKANLRFVIHYNLPGSIEAYYQEAGRAGRDGKPSRCIMLYSFQDKFIQEFFIENAYPSKAVIKQVYEYLRAIDADPIEMTLQDIKDDLGLQIGTTGIGNCENLLEKANAIERLDSVQNAAAIRIDSELHTLVDLLPREARTQRMVLRELERLCENFRGERVLFNPQRLAQTLNMKWEAVNRAIRQLVKLPMIDYIPPFRGRAIHVIDRKRKFSDLEIDFDELQRRKEAEQMKLDQMIRFATSYRCRQLEILEYFGDPDRRDCRNCDNCARFSTSELPNADAAVTSACLFVVQVALSGVARAKGRFGKMIVAQMLTGSDSKKLKTLDLHKLSTFGLLNALRQNDVVSLLDLLIERGFVQQTETTKFRPVVSITPRGQELMTGKKIVDLEPFLSTSLRFAIKTQFRDKAPVGVARQRLESTEATTPRPNSDVQAPKSLDSENKYKNGRQPPTVHETAASYDPREEGFSFDLGRLGLEACDWESDSPQQTEKRELAAAEAVENVDLRFDTPTNHFAESGRVKRSDPALTWEELLKQSPPHRPDLPTADSFQPSYLWTVQLLADGYSAEHVKQIRKIDEATFLDHVTRGLEDGLMTLPQQLMPASKLRELTAFLDRRRGIPLGSLLVELPPGVTPSELMYFVKLLALFDQKQPR